MPWHDRDRIPVTAGPRLVEMADPIRVAAIMRAANVKVILRHKRYVVELQLLDYGDSSRVAPKSANPQSYTSRAEDESNPPNVLHFKRIVPVERWL